MRTHHDDLNLLSLGNQRCTKHVQENGTSCVLKGLTLSMCDAKELLGNSEEEERVSGTCLAICIPSVSRNIVRKSALKPAYNFNLDTCTNCQFLSKDSERRTSTGSHVDNDVEVTP